MLLMFVEAMEIYDLKWLNLASSFSSRLSNWTLSMTRERLSRIFIMRFPSAGVRFPRRIACVTLSAALSMSVAVLIGGKFIVMIAPRRAGLMRSMQIRIAL
jgi:hypothetical protein